MDLSRIAITGKEYAELIAAKHTLTLITNLMHKEMEGNEESCSAYINGEKYMQIIDCYLDMVEVNNVGYPDTF